MSVDKALSRSRGVTRAAYDMANQMKAAGSFGDVMSPGPGVGQLSGFRDQAANKRRYELFRGWVHAAINAIAQEGSRQPVKLAIMKSKDGGTPKKKKIWTPTEVKAAKDEWTVVENHAFLDSLEKPNDAQYRWQFVYSFMINLCLTGWAYVVGEQDESGRLIFYSVPTTWVTPIHDPKPFSRFKVKNPNRPTAESEEFDRDNVCFAFIPHPSNPLAAQSLAGSQMQAIRIDEHIQSSQANFFENGIFPSVVVTVGKDPHPQVPGGLRPRLSAPQRRAVYSAIKKVSGGVANYGNPAIVDGLIESIERISANHNEMGWEKSEKAIRSRILSAFGVHPYILGEEVVGSYAQAYNVEKRFYKRVNSLLDCVSLVMTDFAERFAGPEYCAWWEECVAVDPSQEQKLWLEARKLGDVTQDELRSYMNLPPDEDKNESVVSKALVPHVLAIAEKVKAGALSREQAVSCLVGMGLPDKLSEDIAGEEPEDPTDLGFGEGGESIDLVQDALRALSNPLTIDVKGIEDKSDLVLADV